MWAPDDYPKTMDRQTLEAMLQRVRAMKSRQGPGAAPSNTVLAVASKVEARQRQRAQRDSASSQGGDDDLVSLESGMEVSVASSSPSDSPLSDSDSRLTGQSVDGAMGPLRAYPPHRSRCHVFALNPTHVPSPLRPVARAPSCPVACVLYIAHHSRGSYGCVSCPDSGSEGRPA